MPVGLSYRTYGFFIPQIFGNRLISGGVAVGDFQELIPNRFVKRRGISKVELKVKAIPVAAKVFRQLLYAGFEDRRDRPRGTKSHPRNRRSPT